MGAGTMSERIGSITEGTNFWRYFTDWHTVDFNRYNPEGQPCLMQYSEYKRKRDSGELPAPNESDVQRACKEMPSRV